MESLNRHKIQLNWETSEEPRNPSLCWWPIDQWDNRTQIWPGFSFKRKMGDSSRESELHEIIWSMNFKALTGDDAYSHRIGIKNPRDQLPRRKGQPWRARELSCGYLHQVRTSNERGSGEKRQGHSKIGVMLTFLYRVNRLGSSKGK